MSIILRRHALLTLCAGLFVYLIFDSVTDQFSLTTSISAQLKIPLPPFADLNLDFVISRKPLKCSGELHLLWVPSEGPYKQDYILQTHYVIICAGLRTICIFANFFAKKINEFTHFKQPFWIYQGWTNTIKKSLLVKTWFTFTHNLFCLPQRIQLPASCTAKGLTQNNKN